MATQYASAPASLTIINCRYENRQRLQFTTEFVKRNDNNRKKISTVLFYQVCADTVKAKQSTVEYGRRLCLFCPSNKFTYDLLTLKVVSESRLTWATSVPILIFLGLSILELGPMYATDRQTDRRRQTKASLNAFALWRWRHNNKDKPVLHSKCDTSKKSHCKNTSDKSWKDRNAESRKRPT